MPIARVRQYVQDSSDVLTPVEQQVLRRFFNRRGIYELRQFSWFGWRGLIYAPWTVCCHDADRLEDHATTARIVEFQRGAGRRL